MTEQTDGTEQTDDPKHLIRTHQLAPDTALVFRHPLNPRSEVHMHVLGRAVGMQRAQLSLARIPPGKESFVYHAHAAQEEFVFILSGTGTAEIGEARVKVGPGDYMGFPIDGVGHHLINSGDQDLVYLTGGEHTDVEIGHFPRLGKWIVSRGDQVAVVDDAQLTFQSIEDWLAAQADADEDTP